jgi:hypothetical protein
VLTAAGNLARSLNRTLVEPCVRNGALVSCHYGRVVRVADGSDPRDIATAAAGEEPDGTRTLRFPAPSPAAGCVRAGVDEGLVASENGTLRGDTVLPLRAYYDWAWLRRTYPMVGYHEWEAARVAPRGTSRDAARAAGLLWVDDTAPDAAKRGVRVVSDTAAITALGAFGQAGFGCTPAQNAWLREHAEVGSDVLTAADLPTDFGSPASFGGYTFARGHTCLPGRGAVNPQSLLREAALQQDDAPDLFFVLWQRKVIKWERRLAEPLPPFNPVHYAAARAWLARRVLGDSADRRYGVVQWRSQGKNDDVDWCAHAILNSTANLPGLEPRRAPGGGGDGGPAPEWLSRRMVLVGDLPSPANQCGIWDFDPRNGGSGGSPDFRNRVAAAALFREAGFAKLDEDAWMLDGGVLAVRDAIIASEATWYFGCSSVGRTDALTDLVARVCYRCMFFSGYVHEIVTLRIHAGRRSNLRFDNITPADVVPPLPPFEARDP